MLELLGLLGGAVVRLFPSVMEFFKDGRDLKYELLRMDKEIALEERRAAGRQLEINAMASAQVDTRWADGLVEALSKQTEVTGDKWLDRINVSVRPILTYWWCIVMYTGGKIMLMVSAAQASATLMDIHVILMTDFDRGVVGSIIGFWFVDRALRGKK